MNISHVPFQEAFGVARGIKKIPNSAMKPNGDFPVIDQGSKTPAGYVNDSTGIYRVDRPVITFGDHTRRFKLVDHDFFPGADGVKILEISDLLDPSFAYHLLRSRRLPDAGYSRHFKFLKELSLPIPPLDEQRRIAAILDRAHRSQLEKSRLLAQLSQLRRSTFSNFIKRNLCIESPLSEFATFYSGGTPSRKDEENWGGDIPWFTPKDFKKLELSTSIDRVTHKVKRSEKLRELPAGTIAVVVRGMILAHTFPVCVLGSPGFINQDVKALIPKKDFDHQFLADALRNKSDWILSRISSSAHGTRKLDLPVLSSVPIPDVPYTVQREYAARVSKLNDLIELCERSTARNDELFNALQARAFRGEL